MPQNPRLADPLVASPNAGTVTFAIEAGRHIEDAPLAQIGARYGRVFWPSFAPDALELDVGVERVSKEEVVHSRARAAQDLVVETELYER